MTSMGMSLTVTAASRNPRTRLFYDSVVILLKSRGKYPRSAVAISMYLLLHSLVSFFFFNFR